LHPTSLNKMKAFVEGYLKEFEDTELIIIDVGAKAYLNNPTYRPFFNTPKWRYFGLDLEAGDNVDIVVSDSYSWKEVPDNFADVVISGQAFEHIEFPWLTIKEIYRILKAGAICCIIAPSSGPEHRYPYDCWRFYPDGMKALAKWVGFRVVEIFTDWGLGEWQDTFAVLQKPFSKELINAPFPEFNDKRVAEKVYLEAIKTSPNNPQYYANAIYILKSSRRIDEALNYAILAVSAFPQNIWLRQKLIELYLEKDLVSPAIEHAVFLLRARPINPNSVRVVNNVLKSVADLGKEIILSQIPEDIQTLSQLANFSENTKSYHLMQVCYKKLVEKLPENILLKAMLGLSHKALGDEETFRKTFKELIEYQLQKNILNRTTIIQTLINKFGYKTYLEIGVERGINFFQIDAELKLGVDSVFTIPGGYQDTEKEKFYAMTSDEFFANPPKEILERGLDIVFIDGLHTYEQSLRDVENSLKYLNPHGIIVMHDCLPDSPATAMPTLEEAKKHLDFKGNWTGNVYKTIIHLRATRNDLFVAVVDTDWGVGIVKKGNPEGILSINVEDIQNMSYEEFAKDKEKLLNLEPRNWFYEFIEQKKTGRVTMPNLYLEYFLEKKLSEILPFIQQRIMRKTTWMGVPAHKHPYDFWVYQEIIYEQKPDFIIEIGNAKGGHLLALAHLCDIIDNGKVIGIDINYKFIDEKVRTHPRIILLEGDGCEMFEKVKEIINDFSNILVIEDSSHTYENTLKILRTYSCLIPPGGYFIIEDSICHHGLNTGPNPGPYEAIETFLAENPDFEADREKESFIITWNPKGYLRRKK